MTQRIERILIKLAQQHAPELLNDHHNASPQSLKRLARRLAGYEQLVVMAQVPNHLQADVQMHVEHWARAISNFHDLLAQTLFPNYNRLRATFADDHQPPVLVFEAQISPMVEVMAGYLIPYIASRQSYTTVPEDELRLLVETMLHRLHAHDQPLPIYDILVRDSIEQIRELMRLPVKYIALTDFDERLFPEPSRPATLPKAPQTPPAAPSSPAAQPPASNPAQANGQIPAQPVPPAAPPPQPAQTTPPPAAEVPSELRLEQLQDEDRTHTPTERMFVHPIFLNNTDTPGHTPPVPRPPKRPKKP